MKDSSVLLSIFLLIAAVSMTTVSARDWSVGKNGLSRWDYGIAISMDTTSALFLPTVNNAEAFASPTIRALTSVIDVEPVLWRESPDLCTNDSTRERFAVSFPAAAVRQFKYRRRYEHYARKNSTDTVIIIIFCNEFIYKWQYSIIILFDRLEGS
jgi:hypothetical protein